MSQVEDRLDRASSWWRWQLFLRRTANLATVVLGEVTLEVALGSSFPAKDGATSSGESGETVPAATAAPGIDIEDPGIQSILERRRNRLKRNQ